MNAYLSIVVRVVAAILLSYLVTGAHGQTGSAAGTARELSVAYGFKLATDFRPSAPTDVQIAAATKTTLAIAWSPSAPSQAGRSVDHYEVLRNGVKVGQTAGTQLIVSFDSTSPVLEFFTVRAIDSRGIVSAASVEILPPRTPGLDLDGITIEQKVVAAERVKRGFRGLISDRRYRKGTYVYHQDHTIRNYDSYSTTTREDRNFSGGYDSETDLWSLTSVSGSYLYDLKLLDGSPSPAPVVGTWIAGDRYPPAVELRSPDGTTLERWSLGAFAFYVDRATSETTGQFVNPTIEAVTTVELSDELTEEDFRSGIDRDYAAGMALAPTLGWNALISVSFGDAEILPRRGRFSSLASRVEYDEGDTITLSGCVYRLRFHGTGVKTVRWAEVTTPDDDPDPVVVARQETIDLDRSDGYSREYTVAPPDLPGTTEIRILSAGLSVAPAAPTSSSADPSRIFAVNGVLAGGVAEIAVSTGSGWFDPSGMNSAVLSIMGTDGALRFVAIDPQIEASAGIDAAIAVGVEIAAGTDLLLEPTMPGFTNLGGWKLMAVGMIPGSGTVQLALTTSADPVPNVLSTTITVYPSISLAVDANRDGAIKLASEDASDAVSKDRPYRFWVNDDADQGDASGTTDFSDSASSAANFRDQLVNGTRDLIDFFPVFLDLKPMLAVLPPSASMRYKLKQADGAVNMVYTDRTRAGALEYQTKLFATGFGDPFDSPPGSAATHQITADGYELSSAFLAHAKVADGGVIMVEGRAATTAPLVLSIEQDGVPMVETKLELRISPVEAMFRHIDLTRAAKSYEGKALTIPAYVPATRTGDPGDAWPDSETNGKYFVFIHGFNIDGPSARGWQAEVFKRLHVLGSRARFVGVTWHGATGVKLFGGYTDYHQAVFNAFQTGDALAGALSFTSGADVTVAAHSLGNIVASQAIQSGGFAPARYFMINAAVPMEAYDLGSVTKEQREGMTESKWKTIGDPSIYAANWHDWFSANPADHRNDLKWKERFLDVRAIAYNFYSPGDEVVEDPEWNSPSILKHIFEQGFDLSRGAWVTQEFAKGANYLESIAVAWLSRVQGGWGQSVDYWPMGSSLRSPNQSREPYFGYFLEHDLFDADAGKASARAAQESVRPDLLARGIPAMSFATAVHRLGALGPGARENPDRNFDLEAEGRQAGIWPREGHEVDDKSVGRWLHSDFKNVALPYVFPMYQAMINQGALR